MTDTDLTDVVIAEKLADAARQAILPYFRRADLDAENKLAAGFDPVTAADRDAELAMRAILADLRPQDAIHGEEFANVPGRSGRTWVLDPIDGTRGFISGTPTWGVLIALSDQNGPFLGVIDQPYIGERFIGTPQGAHMVGPMGRRDLGTRRGAALEDAVLFTTFPELGSSDEEAAFRAVSRRVKLTRYGMDCYAYALLAAGLVDLVIEAGLKAVDIQAPIALIRAAGGVVTDWQGGPAHEGGRALAAANPQMHAAALEILSRA
ncbi:histidinol-phosphatase [Ruegeria sp. WL0004]|uniref:Histidinol-phosphatase n=1 Tax=Ruegeria marisflavi TaxID=2984152 RepID=A0ABT2WQX3_9RHOB|nr:histidinol-phosphatase [Ruegeria sp. WL0004]MCU9838292.1 histidinol-phosphatase [Ruegeria sp. WL0004]